MATLSLPPAHAGSPVKSADSAAGCVIHAAMQATKALQPAVRMQGLLPLAVSARCTWGLLWDRAAHATGTNGAHAPGMARTPLSTRGCVVAAAAARGAACVAHNRMFWPAGVSQSGCAAACLLCAHASRVMSAPVCSIYHQHTLLQRFSYASHSKKGSTRGWDKALYRGGAKQRRKTQDRLSACAAPLAS